MRVNSVNITMGGTFSRTSLNTFDVFWHFLSKDVDFLNLNHDFAVSNTNMFLLPPQTDKQYHIDTIPYQPSLSIPPQLTSTGGPCEAISRCSGAADEARKRGLFEVAELLMPRDAWCPGNLVS